jgi:ammonia channel protein AmtB
MTPIAAGAIGILSAIFYMSLSTLLLKIRVDDPLEATGVHAGGGLAGLIGAALFMNNGLAYGLYQWASEGDTQSVKFALFVSYFLTKIDFLNLATFVDRYLRSRHHYLVFYYRFNPVWHFKSVWNSQSI